MQGSASTRPWGRRAETGCSCTKRAPIRRTKHSGAVVEAAAFPGHRQPLGKGQVAGSFSSQFSFLRVFREKKSLTFLNSFHSRFELPLEVQPAKSCPLPAVLAALLQPGPKWQRFVPWPELSPCAEALTSSAPRNRSPMPPGTTAGATNPKLPGRCRGSGCCCSIPTGGLTAAASCLAQAALAGPSVQPPACPSLLPAESGCSPQLLPA